MKFKRNIRVLLVARDANEKDRVWMRGTLDDNVRFFQCLQVISGQTLYLQFYIDGSWWTKLQRGAGRMQEVNIKE